MPHVWAIVMRAGLTLRHLHFRDLDAERFTQVVSGANLEHTITGGERGSAFVAQLRAPTFSLDHGHYGFPVVARGQFAADCICIGFAHSPGLAPWANGLAFGGSYLQVVHEGGELLYRAGTDATWVGLTIRRETLQVEALRRTGRELLLTSHASVENRRILPSRITDLLRMVRSLSTEPGGIPREPEETTQLVIGAYIEALASAAPSTAEVVHRRAAYRADVIRRADFAMRRSIGYPYSSERLCKWLGMTERNLELHFREALGISPRAWFQHLSLHHARTILLRGGDQWTVTEVATACGFEHFGRFSQSYRTLFAELPSETLRHARKFK